MKKIALMIAAFVFTLSVSAQDKMDKMDKKGGKMMDHKMKDCVMMESGKMMVMKGGKTADMTSDMTMSNGAMVSSDGKVTMKDGSTKMMKDGDCMYMDGKMTKMKGDNMKKGKM